jgi:hypothetical protein
MTAVQRIQRLQKTVDTLVQKEVAPKWVKVGFIREITGWRNEKMRQARQQHLIEFEKREDGFWYNVNSLPKVFIK